MAYEYPIRLKYDPEKQEFFCAIWYSKHHFKRTTVKEFDQVLDWIRQEFPENHEAIILTLRTIIYVHEGTV